MSLNKVMLIGNVGKDPEVRYLEGNAKVARFTLATTERFKDRSGEMKENTEWHNLVCWRNSAEVAEKFIKKGTQIYVEGRIRTDSWTDQTGAKRFTTEIVVDNLQLLGRRADNPGAQDGAYSPGAPAGFQPRQSGQPYGTTAQNAGYGAPQVPVQPAYSAPVQPAPAAAPAVQSFDLAPEAGDDDLPF